MGAHFALLLHTGAAIGWTRFTVHPSTVVGIAALAVLYEWAARRLGAKRDENTTAAPSAPSRPEAARLEAARPQRRTASRPHRLPFYAGLVTLFLSLNGWLHDLSDAYLFSAHMVQHLAL